MQYTSNLLLYNSETPRFQSMIIINGFIKTKTVCRWPKKLTLVYHFIIESTIDKDIVSHATNTKTVVAGATCKRILRTP